MNTEHPTPRKRPKSDPPHGDTTLKPGRKRRRPHAGSIAAIAIAAVLGAVLAAHIVLPPLILKAINRELARNPSFTARIGHLDISLLRGAYALDRLDRAGGRAASPESEGPVDTVRVFAARRVDFSVEWRALFRGKLVSEIVLTAPRLNIMPAPPTRDTGTFDFAALRRAIEGFFPFTINRIEIIDGAVHFHDPAQDPPVDVRVDQIHAVARGLTNAMPVRTDPDTARQGDERAALPASVRLTARAQGHAPLRVNLALAPLAERPTFDLDAKLEALDLTTLNSFFRAYAGFDVERGTFGVYTEIAAAEGRFEGYVKPLMRDLKILDPDTDEGGLLSRAWEALVAGAAALLENPPEQQVGTKIAFEGSLNDPQADLWTTVTWLLRNAFVRALQPGLENSIKLPGGPSLEDRKIQQKKEKERS